MDARNGLRRQQLTFPKSIPTPILVTQPTTNDSTLRFSLLPDSECLLSFLGLSASSQKATISCVLYVCLSVRLHGTTRLTRDAFSRHLICVYFSKHCREQLRRVRGGQNTTSLLAKYSINPVDSATSKAVSYEILGMGSTCPEFTLTPVHLI
jgi:hypothetical protein